MHNDAAGAGQSPIQANASMQALRHLQLRQLQIQQAQIQQAVNNHPSAWAQQQPASWTSSANVSPGSLASLGTPAAGAPLMVTVPTPVPVASLEATQLAMASQASMASMASISHASHSPSGSVGQLSPQGPLLGLPTIPSCGNLTYTPSTPDTVTTCTEMDLSPRSSSLAPSALSLPQNPGRNNPSIPEHLRTPSGSTRTQRRYWSRKRQKARTRASGDSMDEHDNDDDGMPELECDVDGANDCNTMSVEYSVKMR